MVGFVTYAKVNSTPHHASALLPVEAWPSENDETRRVIIDIEKGRVEGGVEGGGKPQAIALHDSNISDCKFGLSRWTAHTRRTGNLPTGTGEMALNLSGGVIQQPPEKPSHRSGKKLSGAFQQGDDIAN